MTTTKSTTYYRLHLQPIARTVSFLYRPIDPQMPFRLDYRANESHLTVRFSTIPSYRDFYTRITYDIRLCAVHYPHVRLHERFRTICLTGDDADATGIRSVRVPLQHVRHLTVRIYKKYTVHCRLDPRHPVSPAPQHSALVDWHPAQILAVVAASQLGAFAVPAFGTRPTGIRVLRNETAGTVRFELSLPHDVKYIARTTCLRIECVDPPARRTGWLTMGAEHPLDTQMRELLGAVESHGGTTATSIFVLAVSTMEVKSTPDLELAASNCAYLVQYVELFDDRRRKDLRLLVGGQRVPILVYRVLLSCQSPLIRCMLDLLLVQPEHRSNVAGAIVTLELPYDQPDLWQMWLQFTYTGHVDAGPHLMRLLQMATHYGMVHLQHAVAMAIVRHLDFSRFDWRFTVQNVMRLYPSEALRKLLYSSSADTAYHRCARMMHSAEMYGSAAHLNLRNVFRDALLFTADRTGSEMLAFRIGGQWFRMHLFVLDVMAPQFHEGIAALQDGLLECTHADMALVVRHIYCGDMLVPGVDDPGRTWQLAKHFGLEQLQYEAETCAMAELHASTCPDMLALRLEQMPDAKRLHAFAANMVELRSGMQTAAAQRRHAIEVENRMDYVSDDGDWDEDDDRAEVH